MLNNVFFKISTNKLAIMHMLYIYFFFQNDHFVIYVRAHERKKEKKNINVYFKFNEVTGRIGLPTSLNLHHSKFYLKHFISYNIIMVCRQQLASLKKWIESPCILLEREIFLFVRNSLCPYLKLLLLILLGKKLKLVTKLHVKM